jgi:hypothetical protein
VQILIFIKRAGVALFAAPILDENGWTNGWNAGIVKWMELDE